MLKRVVITGIGCYTSIGKKREEFWNNILAGKFVVKKVPSLFYNYYKFRSKFFVPLPEISFSDFNLSSKYENLLTESSKLAVVCAKSAIEDGGYNLSYSDGNTSNYDKLENSSIILGIGISSLEKAFGSYIAHTQPDIGSNSPIANKRYDRMVIPATMPNSAVAWISILFGIKGFGFTINTACSSGTYAIGEAYRKIKDGYTKSIIAGGVECMKEQTGAIMRGFDTLGTLTTSNDGRPMPFSLDRSGFLFSEGAGCVLILEELEFARKRGANIYAEIVGFESNSDSNNIVKIDESGKQIIKMLKKILGNNKIDYLNTHGTGTLLNDRTESMIIKKVFGNADKQPIINSSKSILGHSIGASGALETAITAMSIKNSRIHANLSENNMGNLNIATETCIQDVEFALTTSYGFGGHNSALLLKKFTD